MAHSGVPSSTLKPGQADGLTVAVITAQWNSEITDELHAHAVRTATEYGAFVKQWRVAGALELPVVVKKALESFDLVVAGGCVIEGETSHFTYVCDSVTYGLTKVAIDAGKPVGNAVLTVQNRQQALDRIGLKNSVEDKGSDATIAAIQSALTLKTIGL